MSIVEVNFRHSKFSLNCDNPSKIEEVASILNERAENIAKNYPAGITDLRALFLTAMMLQDEIIELRNEIGNFPKSDNTDKDNFMAVAFEKVSEYISGITQVIESNVESK
jgi:cell division protein ZapA (FtsZ GTPase activity inhibitor)